jgi:pimeloyl-ACP methyl ester carboxylesterase
VSSNIGRRIDPGHATAQADARRRDFDGSLDRTLVVDVWRRVSQTPVEVVCSMFASFAGYDTAAPARQLRVPVRCINGDLFPTDTHAIRQFIADFDAVVQPHTGHFPMLERPDEFNRKMAEMVALLKSPPDQNHL